MNNSNKIYCGNGKEKTFQDGGSIIEVMLDVDDLAKNFNEHGFTTQQGKRKIKVKVCRGRNIDQYGNTHYVEIDTWKPNSQGRPDYPPQQQQQSQPQQGQPSYNQQPPQQQYQQQGPPQQQYAQGPPQQQAPQQGQYDPAARGPGDPAQRPPVQQGPPPTSFEDDIPF